MAALDTQLNIRFYEAKRTLNLNAIKLNFVSTIIIARDNLNNPCIITYHLPEMRRQQQSNS